MRAPVLKLSCDELPHSVSKRQYRQEYWNTKPRTSELCKIDERSVYSLPVGC